jgi:hypothetical protein
MARALLNTYAPMSYEAGLSFPLLAKMALGVLLLLLVAGIATIRFAIRRVRRRPVEEHRAEAVQLLE